MRKTLYRILYSVILFFAVFVLLEVLSTGTSTQTTTTMSEAVLPVVTMTTGSTAFNTLYGSTQKRDPGRMRPLLTPISSDRQAEALVQLYGQTLTGISMEVRDITGKRLMEEGTPTYQLSGDTAKVSLSFKNLIEPDTEYLLVLILSTQENPEVWYYTRFSYSEEDTYRTMAEEALAFAQSFHTMTFDKSSAEELLTYLEPSDRVSNSSLASVGLYNSADAVTWGDLEPTQVTEPVYAITDIENDYIAIKGSFYVQTVPAGDDSVQQTLLYRCEEYYELRKGTDRFYLMDYERTISQDFDPAHPYGTNGNLVIGIAQSDMQTVQSSDKSVTAFVHDGRLYEAVSSENLLVYIYGFDSAGDTGVRETNADHDIRILHMETDGSLDFLVYGYMNCGRHEGDTGISFYHYSGEYHTLEEKAYVPYAGSFAVLDQRIGQIAHYDVEGGQLYLTLEDALYEIDVNSCSLRLLTDNLFRRSTVISSSGVLIAYEEQQDAAATGRITLLNLNGMGETTVDPGDGLTAVPLGFLGQDLIYGTLRAEDVVSDTTGTVLEPMEHIYIVDQNLNVLEDYHQDGYYVVACEVRDDQILLKRVQRTVSAGGNAGLAEYTAAEDDTISSGTGDSKSTQLTQTTSDARYGTIVQLDVGITDWSKCQYLRPQEILYEGSRELVLQEADNESRESEYYVYNGKGLVTRTRNISDAIAEAEDSNTGVVLNGLGCYVWEKSRAARSEIDALTTMEEGSALRSSREVCLEAMLRQEDISLDVAGRIAEGLSSTAILEEGLLGKATVLNLAGCTLDEVLYYVGEGLPVYAVCPDGNVVLAVGYGPENVELYDPASGSVHLQPISEASAAFEEAGNQFLTFLPETGQ